MKRFEGTRSRVPVLLIILVITLLCSLLASAQQDKLLTNASSENSTTNPTTAGKYNAATVACTQYAADGITCIKGQYFHSDGAQYSSTWNSLWTTGLTNPTYAGTANPAPTVSGFGAWLTGLNSGGTGTVTPSNACIGCHHSDPRPGGSDVGGNYLVGGHKNMLRKVAPGKTWTDLSGLPLASHDTAGNAYDWTNGTITLAGTATTKSLFYLFGWIDEPDVLYDGGGSTSNYQCARCHTTGYRFESSGPEPTKWDGSTPVTDAQISRAPAGGACDVIDPLTGKLAANRAACVANGGTWPTSSWYLSGIQCERCHKADMQADATAYPTNGGRISHLVRIPQTASVPATFMLGTPNSSGQSRPLPIVPVGERSTALCIECHRSEVSTAPTTAGTTTTLNGVAYNLGTVHPAQLPGFENAIAGAPKLGTFKSSGKCSDGSTKTYAACIAAGLTYGPYVPAMSHGANGAQAFLNSPHARFIGTFDQTAQNSPDLSVTLNGTYNSFFTNWGEAEDSVTGDITLPINAGKNAGCAGCHDVHNTNLKVNATNVHEPIAKECTDCHQNGSRYAVANVAHSQGDGTPFPTNGTPSTPCITCHMGAAGGSPTYHYFRINPAANYSTFPSATQYYGSGGGNQQPNTFAETGYGPNGPYTYNAVALDVDIACGQCHTGGDGKSNPYGITPTGAPVFTRASLSNLASGMHNTAPKLAVLPTFSLPGTTYAAAMAPLSVTLYEATAHAGICYTTDGTTPGWVDMTPYAEEATMACTGTGTLAASGTTIQISQTTTLKAIGGGTNSIGNVLTPSGVASITYNFQAAAPTFSVAGGQFSAPQSVQLSDAAGNILYCTVALGGSCTPTTPYTTAILVNVPTTIRAVAGGGNTGFTTSSVAVANYNMVLAAPTFSPGTGNYVGMQSVTITGPAGSTIYYTTDGSVPTTSSASFAPSQTPGTATTGVVNVGMSMYLRAIATFTSGNQTVKSAVGTAVYTIQIPLNRPARTSRDGVSSMSTTAQAPTSSVAAPAAPVAATPLVLVPYVPVVPTLAAPAVNDSTDVVPAKKAAAKKKNSKEAGNDEPADNSVKKNSSVGRNGQ